MLSGTGEVVRIEKTMEVSDRESDDEKTLSNSNENILDKDNADTDDDIDLEVESYNRSVLENPVFVFTETASRTASPPATPRNSRALARTESQRRRAASCTEPRHRRRASPCQRREKEVNLGGNLDTLTESEENLSSELERQAGRAGQQLISGSLDLLAGRVGELPPLPRGHRARSLTPGLANLPDRHRKTVICTRGEFTGLCCLSGDPGAVLPCDAVPRPPPRLRLRHLTLLAGGGPGRAGGASLLQTRPLLRQPAVW